MHGTRVSRITTYTDLNRQNRQRSTSQTSVTDGTDRRQTYGGIRRTSSSTNLRTPRRTPRMTRSPGVNRTPSTAVTSNSELNRRMAPENAAKVMEFIKSDRAFFNQLNMGGGLKTMNHNQFIDIISYLMVQIGGKNAIAKILIDHETVIKTFLEKLNFPYAINSSCLKTPNAHHSYPEVVAILAFLCDLVRDINRYAVPTEMPLKHCDRLINDEYMHYFVVETLNNYKNEDLPRGVLLQEDAERKLLNGMIAAKMKINGLTIDELTAKEEQLRKSSAELQNNLIESDCDKYFRSIEDQFAQKEAEYQKLQDILADKRKYWKMITLTHVEKARALAAAQAKLQQLMHQIQHQKYSVVDIKQLIAKESLIKSSIAMIQDEKKTIEAETMDAQVKLARLQKIKLESIRKFNDLTFQITKTLMQSHHFQELNINDFTIDPNAVPKVIQSICLRLNQLHEHCGMKKHGYTDQIEQIQANLLERHTEFSELTKKHTEQMANLQRASKKLNALNQMAAQLEDECAMITANLQREIAEKIATKTQIDEEIVKLRKKTEALKIENVRLFEEGEQKAHEIICTKKMLNKEMDQLNDFLDRYENV